MTPSFVLNDFKTRQGRKIIVVKGDRNYANDSVIRRRFKLLTAGMKNPSDYVLLHGDGRDGDRMAAAICTEFGWNVAAFPADWDRFGLSAGPIRNRTMLGFVLHLVNGSTPIMECAFHDDLQSSKGTKDCALAALERDIPDYGDSQGR